MPYTLRFVSISFLLLLSALMGLGQETSFRIDFSGDTAEENDVTIMGAGFDTLPAADVSFGVIPTDNTFELAPDGRGAIVTADPGEGVMIVSSIIASDKAALIRGSVRTDTPHASIYLATIGQGEDVFVSTVTPCNGEFFTDQYHRLSSFFIPPSTNGFQALIQIVNTSETESLTAYLDTIEISLLEPGWFYNGEFINGDEINSEITALSFLNDIDSLLTSSDADEAPLQIDLSKESLERSEIMLTGAGFDSIPQARVFFTSIPTQEDFPNATDGLGAAIIAAPGEGVIIWGPRIETSYAALIRCSIRSNNAAMSAILAALDEGPNAFVTTNTSFNKNYFLYQYKRLSTYFAPPSTGFQPLIQIMNISENETLIAYLDNFEVFPLKTDRFYNEALLDGDETDPDWNSISEEFVAQHISSPTLTIDIPNLPDSAIPLEMTRIPHGTFLMGSRFQPGFANESPQHWETIDNDFYLGTYEVTNAQFSAFLQAKGNLSPEGQPYLFTNMERVKIQLTGGKWTVDAGYENHPVIEVSWYGARDFCVWISELAPSLQGRLPTEVEWEYACRAGTETRYYWGEDPDLSMIDHYAWYEDNSGANDTIEVGRKQPNQWGLYDMSGNVWEWCIDSYRDKSIEELEEVYKVIRGGGWDTDALYCRSAVRNGYLIINSSNDIGFRITASIKYLFL